MEIVAKFGNVGILPSSDEVPTLDFKKKNKPNAHSGGGTPSGTNSQGKEPF